MNRLYTILGILVSLLSLESIAQIGVNTIAPKASLQVIGEPTNKKVMDGIIPPKLTGNQLNNKTYPSHLKGVIVYVTDARTDTDKGQCKQVLSSGYYYFDGQYWRKLLIGELSHQLTSSYNTLTSKVDNITANANIINSITQELNKNDLTLNVNGITNTITLPNIYTHSGALTSDRTVRIKELRIKGNGFEHFSIGDNLIYADLAKQKIGVGNSAPIANLDIRTNPGASNPGEGYLGIGKTTRSASQVGKGGVRYEDSSKNMEYSDGVRWKKIESIYPKVTIVAKKVTSQSISNSGTGADVIDWKVLIDVTNSFNPATGYFTAPHDGNYIVSFSYAFKAALISSDRSQVEAILITKDRNKNQNTSNDKKKVSAFLANGKSPSGASISFVIKLKKEESVHPFIWHRTALDNPPSAKELRVSDIEGSRDDGYVNFSVVEL